MKDTIVLYPSPGIGHLVAMVELGKRLVQHNAPFSITILITQASFNTGSTAPYIQRISSSFPSISFHHLPPISLPLDTKHETLIFRLLQLNNPLVLQSLLSITSQPTSIRALVFDFFCHSVSEVAAQLHIPSYSFYTSGLSGLAILLYLPTFHRLTESSLKDLGHTHLDFPGIPPIPASDLPPIIHDRNGEAYDRFLGIARALSKVNGIIVNSFDSLEPRAVKAISDGACVPDGPTPPIYCIGPLIAESQGDDKGAECLEWLDSQPSRSVVFLCFGSMGRFSAAQVKEIAVGLEKSEQRFLWVVRSPPSENKARSLLEDSEPDLDSLLPDGFLERTKGRGLVIKSWAPQVAVLNRDSVGGFVTHCGWNSVLEALSAGVPLVAWPLYAEQRLNRVVLVEELKLAMPMEESDESGLVKAEEVERRVRELIESKEGIALRERMIAMKEMAKAAVSDGGSSDAALMDLAKLWMVG